MSSESNDSRSSSATSGSAPGWRSTSRVADEAVAGRSNREIAQAFFVTPKAIEFHLANAYRKLDISSRTELAGVMAPPEAGREERRP